MVLHDLGKKISAAFSSLNAATAIDEKILDSLLLDICKALLESDVNVHMVQGLRKRVKSAVIKDVGSEGLNKKKIIQKAVFDELCNLVEPGVDAFKPKKGKSNVVMFCGLQGSGKTTTCTKFAYYYQRRGWKTCLVCADTFRAGAFDQLKQNAAKVKIPFYGSYTESNPVRLSKDGVKKFKEEGFEIIIVDTSGRHKQEEDLFEEMKQIELVTQPDNVIFVVDASIGQAAESQANAFKNTVNVGSVIITKMDGHAKGGGAISAVAATHSPIIFIGTGEHFHALEPFQAKKFIGKMLGFGDLDGLFQSVKELNLEKDSEQMMKRIVQGQFTLRDFYEQFQKIMQLGPLTKVMGMIPGMSEEMFPKGTEENTQQWFRKMLCIMDSMTDQELDSDGKCFDSQPTRLIRISRGSGSFPEETAAMLNSYRQMADMVKKMGGKHGLIGQMAKQGTNLNPNKMNQQQFSQLAQLMGGNGGNIGSMQQMLKQFQDPQNAGGMPDFGNLGSMMQALGGLGGRLKRK